MENKEDEMIIKKKEYYDLLIENSKLREQASPFHKYSINEIRQMLGFSKLELEEEKKIPEEMENYKSDDNTISGLRKTINVMYDDTVNKINEIIDYLDYLQSKGDE